MSVQELETTEKTVDTSKQKKLKKDEYLEAVGRRKTATARVRILKGSGVITVEGKKLEEYFPTDELQKIVTSPLEKAELADVLDVTVKVNGGGVHAQAEAVRHGLSRALVLFNLELRGELKSSGYLKRDPRRKERKKFGLRGARRRPQWSKR